MRGGGRAACFVAMAAMHQREVNQLLQELY